MRLTVTDEEVCDGLVNEVPLDQNTRKAKSAKSVRYVSLMLLDEVIGG